MPPEDEPNINADAYGNGDWIKAVGWNLPESTEEFLVALGIRTDEPKEDQRAKVEHFMTLPAAEAMPLAAPMDNKVPRRRFS